MHEDDEQRFPRISLWQLLVGAFRWTRGADKFFDGRWVSDLATMNAADKKPSESGSDAEKGAVIPGPRSGARDP